MLFLLSWWGSPKLSCKVSTFWASTRSDSLWFCMVSCYDMTWYCQLVLIPNLYIWQEATSSPFSTLHLGKAWRYSCRKSRRSMTPVCGMLRVLAGIAKSNFVYWCSNYTTWINFCLFLIRLTFFVVIAKASGFITTSTSLYSDPMCHKLYIIGSWWYNLTKQ